MTATTTLSTDKKPTRVVAAVVERDGKYLCMQRTRSHYPYISEHWEFPGGKVEAGESDHEALIREIKEEMDWDVFVGRKLATVEHEYPDFSITITAYLCRGADEDFKLLEHLHYQWLPKEALPQLNWTAADKKIVEEITKG